MPSNSKTCFYKNCKDTRKSSSKENGITFFKFPKDPERRKLWFQHADVPPNIPEHCLYICSKHFDRKYISQNQRRLVLVGPAVPRASTCKNIEAAPPIQAQRETEKEGIDEPKSDLSNEFENAIRDQLDDNTTTISVLETTSDNNTLIDSQHVSKFTYNGQVYVKMTLDYYEREKQALLDKIQVYEIIIGNIKNDIQQFEGIFKT